MLGQNASDGFDGRVSRERGGRKKKWAEQKPPEQTAHLRQTLFSKTSLTTSNEANIQTSLNIENMMSNQEQCLFTVATSFTAILAAMIFQLGKYVAY